MVRGVPVAPASPATRWLVLVVALLADIGSALGLFWANVSAGAPLDWWIHATAPTVVYALVALVGLRRASVAARVAGAIALCGAHAALGLVHGGLYAMLSGASFGAALTRVVWDFPLIQLLQLLWVPMAVLAGRDLLSSAPRRRRKPRRVSASGPPPAPAKPRTPVTPAALGRGGARIHATPPPSTMPAAREVIQTPVALALPPAPATPVTPSGEAALLSAAAVLEPEAETLEIQAPEESRPKAAESLPLTARVETPAPAAPDDADLPRAHDTVSLEPVPAALSSRADSAKEPDEVTATLDVAHGAAGELSLERLAPEPIAKTEEAVPAMDRVALATAAEAPVHDAALSQTESDRLTALFAPFRSLLSPSGSLEVEAQSVDGATLFTVFPPRLAKEALVRVAVQLLPILAESRSPQPTQPIDQLTLRGSEGALVMTPLGPLNLGGPVLLTGARRRGSLALLEMLSGRAATDYHAAHPDLATSATPSTHADRWEPAARRLQAAEVPGHIGGVAECLEAFGPVAPSAFRDASGDVVLYLFLPAGTEAHALGQLACDLYHAVEGDAGSGGIGAVHSIVIMLGGRRVVVRPVPVPSRSSTLLVAAGGDGGRAGLAYLQLERAAARLASA